MTLPPRKQVPVEVEFIEPASDDDGQVTVQPLASEQPTDVVNTPCTQG